MGGLADLIPRSFHTFFGRFDRLMPIQEAAIPVLVSGADLLIAAPTATGKTEAFAAPAAEMVLGGDRRPASIILVSPTRALANDLKRRLEARFIELGIRLGRYTGEHKERSDGRLAEVLITTPESLDSLLARRSSLLAANRLIVLDEIHVLDGNPRGDQLRVLLHRLEQAADHAPQRVAASATVEDTEGVAARYLRRAEIVTVGGGRGLRARRFDGATPADMAAHLQWLAEKGFRKILVFCSRRADVENFVVRLRGHCVFDDQVFPHHGSLSQAIRERTERRFLEAPAAVAFATMTLEMGIDIGSVDYVLLASPPADVASLLQRIGRGNRRGEFARFGYLVAGEGQALRYRVLFESGARGQLLGHPYGFRPGVIAQQAAVLTGGMGWIDAARLSTAIPDSIWKELEPTGPDDILAQLAKDGEFEPQPARRYVLTDDAERRYDRGVLHANIESEVLVEVVDRLTGDIIGQMQPREERRMNLGGQGRKVVRVDEDRVLSDASSVAEAPTFQSRGSPFCSLALARAVLCRLGLGDDEIRQQPHGPSWLLAHGLGTAGALFLQTLVERDLGRAAVDAASPYVFRLSMPLAKMPEIREDEIDRFVTGHEKKLARLCGMGPHHRRLPVELREASVGRCADLFTVVEFVSQAQLVKIEDPDEESSITLADL